MGEPLPKSNLDSAVDPAEVAKQTFAVERRGFDQAQVQQYLGAVAEALRDAQKREADMRTRLGKAIRRAEAAEKSLREAPTHDIAQLNHETGEQVEKVLEEARIAGEQRVAAAEKSARQILENAKAEATELRNQADAVLRERTTEAEVAAADIVASGNADADEIRAAARRKADELLARAADRLERARNEGDALVVEAEEARAQILEDMERRRRQARAQVERLRVGRDRLLRSYDVVRRTLEETTVELKSSLGEAKVRGDGAARAVIAEPAATREQLEAEIRDAKMIGRIAVRPEAAAEAFSNKVADEPQQRSSSSTAKTLRSPALPRPLDPPRPADADGADPSARPVVSLDNDGRKPKRRSPVPPQPKAPAVAPTLTASPPGKKPADDLPLDPIAAMIAAAEAKKAGTAAPVPAGPGNESAVDEVEVHEPLDEELAKLEDDDLNVIEPSDEIEEVVALDPVAADGVATQDIAADEAGATIAAPRNDLFEMLRAQSSGNTSPANTEAAEPTKTEAADTAAAEEATETAAAEEATETAAPDAPESPSLAETAAPDAPESPSLADIEAQRDAVVADAARHLEKRLKRALADEQNDLLAGMRAAHRKRVALISIVGDLDDQLARYVVAITEAATVTYGAGAALVDAEAEAGRLPAGAVEELLTDDVVKPIRARLEELDGLEVDAADDHLDAVRSFYRRRKTDHLNMVAIRLAHLLCVAGMCDSLPRDSALLRSPASAIRQPV